MLVKIKPKSMWNYHLLDAPDYWLIIPRNERNNRKTKAKTKGRKK